MSALTLFPVTRWCLVFCSNFLCFSLSWYSTHSMCKRLRMVVFIQLMIVQREAEQNEHCSDPYFSVQVFIRYRTKAVFYLCNNWYVRRKRWEQCISFLRSHEIYSPFRASLEVFRFSQNLFFLLRVHRSFSKERYSLLLSFKSRRKRLVTVPHQELSFFCHGRTDGSNVVQSGIVTQVFHSNSRYHECQPWVANMFLLINICEPD